MAFSVRKQAQADADIISFPSPRSAGTGCRALAGVQTRWFAAQTPTPIHPLTTTLAFPKLFIKQNLNSTKRKLEDRVKRGR
jgi:hypothetical protein